MRRMLRSSTKFLKYWEANCLDVNILNEKWYQFRRQSRYHLIDLMECKATINAAFGKNVGKIDAWLF